MLGGSGGRPQGGVRLSDESPVAHHTRMQTHHEGSTDVRRVRWYNLVAYGAGDMYGGGSFVVISLLFLFFLTDVAGLRPALAAAVVSVGRIFDAVTDPLMGYISDTTRSRFGRRRVYFLVGIVPVAVTFAALWYPAAFTTQLGLFAYYAGAYVLFSAVYTLVMVPYSALPAEMTTDFRVRGRLSGARLIGGQASTLAAAVIPNLLIDLGGGGSGDGYFAMGVIFGVIYALPWVLVFAGTWELPSEGSSPSGSVRAYMRRVGNMFRSRTFRAHMLVYIFCYSAIDLLITVFTFFVTYSVGRPDAYFLALGALLVSQLVFIPIHTWIGNRIGKAASVRIGLVAWAVGVTLVGLLVSAETPTALIMLLAALVGTGTSAAVLVPWSMLPTTTDVGELMSGSRQPGAHAGAMTFFRKGTNGLIVAPLIGLVLELAGLEGGSGAVGPGVGAAVRYLFVFGQLGFITLAFGASFLFRVDPERFASLRRILEALRRGTRVITDEDRDLVTLVTGQDPDEVLERWTPDQRGDELLPQA